MITYIILGLFAFWLLWILISLFTKPRLRIVQYENDYFYIEALSAIIPFLWHRRLEFDYDGDITRNIEESPRCFYCQDEARKRIREYEDYISNQSKFNKRKKIIRNKKSDVEELYTEAGRLFARGDEHKGQLILKQIEKHLK